MWGSLLPPVAAAAALALVGWRRAAVLVLLVGVTIAVATRAWPRFGRWVEHGLAGFGRLVARVLTVVLLSIVEVLVFLPVASVALVFRLSPFGHGRWERRGRGTARPERAYGVEPERVLRRGPVRRAVFGIAWTAGVVVLLIVSNYVVGWTWDELWGDHDTPIPSAAPLSVDALGAAPQMAAAAWREEYWREYLALEYDYVPFLNSRVADVDGRYITSVGGERRSYVPDQVTSSSLEVWFFGGSALWGQGQRDLQTIPSVVARRAEIAGTPLRVANFGQPGYTTWQSALLLEQQLAVRPPPDLVVFYDGADDVAVQVERRYDDPSHYNSRAVSGLLEGRDSAREQLQEWMEEYRETSAVNRLAQGLRGVFAVQPAAADEAGLEGRVSSIRMRSLDLASSVALRHGVPVVFALQASAGVPGDGGAYRGLDAALLPESVSSDVASLDLRSALDDEADGVYLDGVLTNEEGARLVGAALWRSIADDLV